jgi:hypothetical protein
VAVCLPLAGWPPEKSDKAKSAAAAKSSIELTVDSILSP